MVGLDAVTAPAQAVAGLREKSNVRLGAEAETPAAQ